MENPWLHPHGNKTVCNIAHRSVGFSLQTAMDHPSSLLIIQPVSLTGLLMDYSAVQSLYCIYNSRCPGGWCVCVGICVEDFSAQGGFCKARLFLRRRGMSLGKKKQMLRLGTLMRCSGWSIRWRAKRSEFRFYSTMGLISWDWSKSYSQLALLDLAGWFWGLKWEAADPCWSSWALWKKDGDTMLFIDLTLRFNRILFPG